MYAALALAVALLWPGVAVAQAASLDGVALSLEVVAEGLDQPLYATAPANDPRLFLVEQGGVIRVLKDGVLLPEPFLDISDRISFGGERGLLGLAFHPDHASNGRFFVNYTDVEGDTRIEEYRLSGNADVAARNTATTILTVDQPAGNHNGGWIGFGPDGFLFIAMGDGGGAGDRSGNGQNPNARLGKILRIDVDGGQPYAIPAGNPFAAGGGAPEIFLLGVRNPWRPSFDGDDLYVADVGQRRFEELTVVDVTTDAGANLGWNVMEGEACFQPRNNCDTSGLTQPHFVYPLDAACSIIGGYVYRGAAIPEITGRYVFSDFCDGRVYALRFDGETASDLVTVTPEPIGTVTSFGQDAAGELYVVHDDKVSRLVPAR